MRTARRVGENPHPGLRGGPDEQPDVSAFECAGAAGDRVITGAPDLGVLVVGRSELDEELVVERQAAGRFLEAGVVPVEVQAAVEGLGAGGMKDGRGETGRR
jgi:hypothetical protein